MSAVEFRTLGQDDDGMLELQVTVEGNGHVCTHKTYLYPEDLNVFGAALQFYPLSETREAVLEAGSPDPGWYGYMRLRVFLLSGFGRSALEMQYETRGELPNRANVTFYVRATPPRSVDSARRSAASFLQMARRCELNGEMRE